MKKNFLIISLAILFSMSVQSQMDQVTGDAITDLPVLLQSQEVTVDIIDQIRNSDRDTELLKKFETAFRTNYDWFLEFYKTNKEEGQFNYHPNFGLTEAEFIEFKNYITGVIMVSSGTEELKITKTDTIVTFNGKGKLAPYNNLKIDIKNNKAYYKNYVLTLKDPLTIEDAENGLASKWKGYKWSYEYSSQGDEVDFSNLEDLSLTIVEVTVGQLERTGKIYMQLRENSAKDGVNVINIKIPILF